MEVPWRIGISNRTACIGAVLIPCIAFGFLVWVVGAVIERKQQRDDAHIRDIVRAELQKR